MAFSHFHSAIITREDILPSIVVFITPSYWKGTRTSRSVSNRDIRFIFHMKRCHNITSCPHPIWNGAIWPIIDWPRCLFYELSVSVCCCFWKSGTFVILHSVLIWEAVGTNFLSWVNGDTCWILVDIVSLYSSPHGKAQSQLMWHSLFIRMWVDQMWESARFDWTDARPIHFSWNNLLTLHLL